MRDPRCPMGCSVQCGPAAPVCVETDASSWRGFLLWTHSSPGLLGCFRVVYTVQYSTVYSVQHNYARSVSRARANEWVERGPGHLVSCYSVLDRAQNGQLG